MSGRNNEQITKQKYDVAIIGGGITGAGILREAAKRGYKAILLEKGDYASGTSSKSAKLVHGGVRYLANLEIGLVRESLRERNYLLRHFPHLVKPQPICFPIYSSKFKYRIGLYLYKLLSWDDILPDYRFLEPDETIEQFPSIDQNELKGSFIYYDCITDDARLTNEVIAISRYRYGVEALNYCEVMRGEQSEEGVTLHCEDKVEGAELTIQAKYVLNAAGAWMDDLLGKLDDPRESYGAPSKGAHIILSRDRFPIKSVMGFSSYAGDERYLYAIPWQYNSVIIGTTDTEFNGNPDELVVGQEDIDYLLHAVQRFAPKLNITQEDVLTTYAGLRPLYREDKISKDRTRDYQVWWNGERLLNILGGKLTSFHSMAKAMLRVLAEKMPAPNGGQKREIGNDEVAADQSISEALRARIHNKYSTFAPLVLTILLESDEMRQPLSDKYDVLMGELAFFIRHQQCVHIDDLLSRRVPLRYVLPADPDGKQLIEKAAALLQKERALSGEAMAHEVERGEQLLAP